MNSIIIPSFNEKENLIKTLEAVYKLEDEIKNCEIIIADDCSTDGSVDAAKKAFPDIRVTRHTIKNYGTSCGKALGADAARGEAMLFLDAHTAPQPGSISTLFELALKTKACVTPIVTSLDVETWTPRGGNGHCIHHDKESWHGIWHGLDVLKKVDDLYENYGIPGQSFAIYRPLYDAVGGWDRGLIAWGSDMSLGLRILCLGYKIYHCPHIKVGHHFKKKFNQYKVAWWEVLANRLRILYNLATSEETKYFCDIWKQKYKGAFEQAYDFYLKNNYTAAVLQPRVKMSIMEYFDLVKRK